jgi:hypothetical protein
MENKMRTDFKFVGSFDDYMQCIKDLIKTSRHERTEMGRSIREIHFLEDEVEPNFEYFRECYDSHEDPEYVVSNLKYNEDELFRKIDNLTDNKILEEVNSRCLAKDVISNADTDDLEDEIEDRWDTTMVQKSRISREELLDMLMEQGYDYRDISSPKAIICELLGFYNSWSVSYEEACVELKKMF